MAAAAHMQTAEKRWLKSSMTRLCKFFWQAQQEISQGHAQAKAGVDGRPPACMTRTLTSTATETEHGGHACKRLLSHQPVSGPVCSAVLVGSTAARSCIKQTALWLDAMLASLKVTWTWWCDGGQALLGGELP